MSSLIAGAASGMLMACLFIGAGVLMLLPLVKDPPPGLRLVIERHPPSSFVMPVVIAAYPIWAIIGVVMGLLYEISLEQAPGSGLGSPNLVFTAAVLVTTAMLTAPFLVLLRRVAIGVMSMGLASMGVFGWFLPYFAA